MAFFVKTKIKSTKNIFADMPVPSILYRNNFINSVSIAYSQIINYVPRILANITKYSIIKWLLIELNINYTWLLMLLVLVL